MVNHGTPKLVVSVLKWHGGTLTQRSENRAGKYAPCFTEEEMGPVQRTKLSWAEVVDGGPRTRPSPLHVSHEKVFVQAQVTDTLFPSPLPLGDASGTEAPFSPVTSRGLPHHPMLAGHLQIPLHTGLSCRSARYHCE